MKRYMRLLALLAALTLVIAACGGSEEGGDTTEAEAPATTEAPAPDTTEGSTDTTEGSTDTTEVMVDGSDISVALVFDIGGRGDQSFNDAAARGFDEKLAEYGFEPVELQANTAGDDRDELLDLAASQGAALVIGNGFLFEDAVEANAEAYPETFFAITDAALADADFAPYDLPNVSELLFAEHEGSFLVGAAAALKSTTGKIGFIGGVAIPLIQKFEAGYRAGAEYINPDIEIVSNYLTQPPDFTGFTDPAKGAEAANAMYDGGADVVYHAAGGSGGGLFESAKAKSEEQGTQLWAIGVDSDQYLTASAELQPYILTSMLKRVDIAVASTIDDVINGSFTGGDRVFDLSVDGVGYSTTGGFVDDIAAQLDELKAMIIDGTIEVPSTLG
ncbi:MAG: BMP family ABC transporter substrate-binding protein [Acidimicrobiia bacterium]|nr:BMP family ABC transporter substrate-binding protein [Acidimicrobiia bacterium]MDH4309777.1 BMP family ABC transporter substrate-binding protein [Acidimicrobiia bacterium]